MTIKIIMTILAFANGIFMTMDGFHVMIKGKYIGPEKPGTNQDWTLLFGILISIFTIWYIKVGTFISIITIALLLIFKQQLGL